MSRTLGRIRRFTGDQIMVRTGRTMTPTPYAQRVREEVHLLVQQAQAVLRPEGDLNLSSLERTFTLRCHDALTQAIAPTLLARLQDQAPGVRIRFLTETSNDTHELRHGQVDVEISSAEPELLDIHFEVLGQDELVIALQPDHLLATGRLSAERYAGARHISVSRRGRLHDPIDDLLEAQGLHRQVVAAVPNSAAALQCVAQSGAVALIPERMCRALTVALGLTTRTLPFPTQPTPIVLAWHKRYDDDRGHSWLRLQIREIVLGIVLS